jgi:hypothetical protein
MRCAPLVLVLCAGWDWPEANPGRPSFSDNAMPTATGAFEVETGLASSDDGDTATAQWTLKYGVTEHVDVRLNLEHAVWGGGGLAGASALLKVMLRAPGDGRLGIAVEPSVTLDSEGGGAGMVATYLTHGFQIDANVVADVARAESETAVTVTPIVAIGHPIGALEGYLEGLVDVPVAGGGGANPAFGLGLGYAVTKFLIVDAAFYVGDEPRRQAFAGLTYSMYLPPRHKEPR